MTSSDPHPNPAADAQARLEAFLAAARAIGGAGDHETLIREILSAATAVMNAEASSVFIPDPATRELVMYAPIGSHASQLQSIRIPDDRGIAGAVFHSREPVNVPDVTQDPRFFGGVDRKTGFVTRSILCVPILHQGEVLGVLQILNARSRPGFSDADQIFFEGFAGLVASMVVRMRAEEQRLAQKRIEQELAFAREIQRSFLPSSLPAASCVRLAVSYEPAREVGGDFYFVEECSSGRVLVVAADVSGKGMPAALTMARATAELRVIGQDCLDLGEWMGRFNRAVARGIVAGRFIGVGALLFDPGSAVVQVCAAGIPEPLVRENGVWTKAEVTPQLALGIFPEYSYHAATFPLAAGTQWMLVTDGVTEARDRAGAEFEAGGVIACLPSDGGAPACVRALREAVNAFAAGAKPHDDATILSAEYRGPAPEAAWSVPADVCELAGVRRRIEQWCAFAGFSDEDTGLIVLAVDEAAANVVRHAYGSDRTGPIDFQVFLEPDKFAITLRDYGKGCDPSTIRSRDLDDVRPGGLGVHFMHTAFSEVEYVCAEPGTLLRLARPAP